MEIFFGFFFIVGFEMGSQVLVMVWFQLIVLVQCVFVVFVGCFEVLQLLQMVVFVCVFYQVVIFVFGVGNLVGDQVYK